MAVSNPRTSPTVKPSAALNRRALRTWELRLGTLQAVVVAVVLIGCITLAFFIGLFSGRRAGLETALQRVQSSVSRVPINVSQDAEVERKSDQIVSDVYRTLQDRKEQKSANVVSGAAEEEMPELAKIETSQNLNASDKSQLDTPHQAEQLDVSALEPLDKLPPPQGKPALVAKEPGTAANTLEAIAPNQKSEQVANLGTTHTQNSDAKASAGLNQTRVESRLLDDPDKDGLANANSEAQKKVVADLDHAAITDAKGATKIESASGAAATSVFDSSRLPKGWFAQVAAPKKRDDADTIARQLKGSGFKVVIESALVRGEAYFRILVGPEGTREQADRLIQQLKRESYIKSDPFVRMVR